MQEELDSSQEKLDLPENEKRLYEISFFVKEKIDAFADSLISDISERSGKFAFKELIEKLKSIWPEFKGNKAKPDFLLPEKLIPLNGKKVTIRFEQLSSEAGHFGNEVDIRLPLKRLLEANSPEEIREAITSQLQVIFHEVEHIEFEGASVEDESAEAGIRYLANYGETRAHAKQYAFLYSQLFPGEPFELEKMKSIIGKADYPAKAENYFIKFNTAEIQEKYKEVADLAGTHEAIVSLTGKFVSEM